MGDVVHGRFELLAEVGAGGMGMVHRARELETGHLVAVKLLSPRAGRPTASSASRSAPRTARPCSRSYHGCPSRLG